LGARLALRVSEEEKELWVVAAGGERRLSEWVRERLNASLTERGGEVLATTRADEPSRANGPSVASPASNEGGNFPRSVSAGFGMRKAGKCVDPQHGRAGWKCKGCGEMF
jgi:hypothetical protein